MYPCAKQLNVKLKIAITDMINFIILLIGIKLWTV
jgi:hypothetical protein